MRPDEKSKEMGNGNYGGDGGMVTSKRDVAITHSVLTSWVKFGLQNQNLYKIPWH